MTCLRHRPDTPDSEEGSKSELNQNTDRVNVLKRKRKPRSPNKKKRTLRNKYICPYCKNELGGRQSLSDHIRFVHFGEKPHKCEECSEAFTTSYKLASHVKRRHSQESFSCSGCDKEFKTRRSWAFHEAAICRVEGWSEERLKNECNLVLVSCKVKGCGKLMDQSMPDRIKRWVRVGFEFVGNLSLIRFAGISQLMTVRLGLKFAKPSLFI